MRALGLVPMVDYYAERRVIVLQKCLTTTVLEETVAMEEPAEEMVETILGDEYSVTEKSKSVQGDATSQEPNYMELLEELQSLFVCLQYEFQYNLDKISDLDYEHRYKNPDYATYQANMARILDKSSYINQWTADKSERGFTYIVVQTSQVSQLEVL